MTNTEIALIAAFGAGFATSMASQCLRQFIDARKHVPREVMLGDVARFEPLLELDVRVADVDGPPEVASVSWKPTAYALIDRKGNKFAVRIMDMWRDLEEAIWFLYAPFMEGR